MLLPDVRVHAFAEPDELDAGHRTIQNAIDFTGTLSSFAGVHDVLRAKRDARSSSKADCAS